ncbi:hypothetical protein HYPSUDRAFT_200634 [Hypholoma sublateritium FD-334 SS-4]|uniref:Uncharacterized protein n=1 Tax=Hypholoma sublateritium (strain FD-334 SS-4) TaxID=945553 RepID=A0A0D2P0F9_HYPSF|nr:hypothetical protein HYPSUDRAFT_200634 [Hypholoma sublateritium FD-334 SS-4]
MYMPGPRNMVLQPNIPAHRYTSNVIINYENSGNVTYTNISNSNNINGRRVRYPPRSTDRETLHRAPSDRRDQLLIAPESVADAGEWFDVDDGEDDSAASAQDANRLPPPYTPAVSSVADAEPQPQTSTQYECPGFVTITIMQAGNVRRDETRLCTHETRECANKREMIRRQWFNGVGAQPPIPAVGPVFGEVRFRNSFPQWMQRYM